jgi:hypothetical protein
MSVVIDMSNCPQVGSTVFGKLEMCVSLYCGVSSLWYYVNINREHLARFGENGPVVSMPVWMFLSFTTFGRIVDAFTPQRFQFAVGFGIGVAWQWLIYYRFYLALVMLRALFDNVLCVYGISHFGEWFFFTLSIILQLGLGGVLGFSGSIYIAEGHFMHFSRWHCFALVAGAMLLAFIKANVG